MIKFFRKIRQRLLSENKVSKYFLYAFGEIVLVILGILIALLINEWRTGLAAQKNEAFILESLFVEFSNAKLNISDYIKSNQDIVETNNEFLIFTSNFEREFQAATFDSLLYNSAWNAGLVLNQGVFKELFNTGNLSKISNNKLRVLLSSWDGLLKAVNDSEGIALDYLQNKITNYFDKRIPWLTLAKYDRDDLNLPIINTREMDRIEIAKDLELENFIYNQIWFTQNKVRAAQKLLVLNQEILKEIKE